jgi:putative hydrolase of the HAD superfamily
VAVRGVSERRRAPRAVLLDALGTLVRLEPPAANLRAELSRRFGLSVSESQAQRAMTAEMTYYRAHLDEGRDPTSLEALRRRCAQVVRDELPDASGASAIELEPLTEALLASLHFSAYPDAAPALDRLRAAGTRLVVVSNWDVSLPTVIERIGLAGLVDGVLTSAGTGARKPAPGIFEKALAVAGATRGEALHIGDGLEEDVEGARAAGIEAVYLARDGARAPPGVRTITTLAEL